MRTRTTLPHDIVQVNLLTLAMSQLLQYARNAFQGQLRCRPACSNNRKCGKFGTDAELKTSPTCHTTAEVSAHGLRAFRRRCEQSFSMERHARTFLRAVIERACGGNCPRSMNISRVNAVGRLVSSTVLLRIARVSIT